MKRKPTRKRPDTPAVLRSLVRIIRRQTEAIHVLRLDVQSMRHSQGELHKIVARLLANAAVSAPPAPMPGMPSMWPATNAPQEPNTAYPPPLGALATDRMTNADMERELNERLVLPSLSGGAGLPQEPSDSPRSRNAHGESVYQPTVGVDDGAGT